MKNHLTDRSRFTQTIHAGAFIIIYVMFCLPPVYTNKIETFRCQMEWKITNRREIKKNGLKENGKANCSMCCFNCMTYTTEKANESE